MGLQYKICYKKGSTNNADDALSRVPPHEFTDIMALSSAQPIWLAHLQDTYEQDLHAKQLLAELTIHSEQGHFSLIQGVIRYKGRIWLGHNVALQQKVMQALHSSAIGGHSGSSHHDQNQETVLLAIYETENSDLCC